MGYEHKAFENACMYNVKFEFHNELSMLRHQKNFSEKNIKKAASHRSLSFQQVVQLRPRSKVPYLSHTAN